jgi:hypothetical protein
LRAESFTSDFDFRQVVSHHINTTMHINAIYYCWRVEILRVAANEVRQQVTRQRAVRQMCKVQVS